jgi:hypothetical protein
MMARAMLAAIVQNQEQAGLKGLNGLKGLLFDKGSCYHLKYRHHRNHQSNQYCCQ